MVARSLRIASLAAACLAFAATPAAADDTFILTADGTVAVPSTDPFDETLEPGFMGGVGGYYSFAPALAGGLRGSAGVLPSEANGGEDVTLGLVSAALRIRPFADSQDVQRATGLWTEVGAGLAIIEDVYTDIDTDEQIGFEAGIGYGIEAGNLGVSPFARVVHIVRDEDETIDPEGSDLVMANFGLEIAFFDDRPEPEPKPEPETQIVFVDREVEVEVPVYIPVPTGMENDRLVVEEDVFFDYDRAELRESGKAKLDEMVAFWEVDGKNWQRLIIRGHADERGPSDYNVDLSARRAQAVAHYLMNKGVPATQLDTVAYGESMPRVKDATTPEEYQKNRRVEFSILRK